MANQSVIDAYLGAHHDTDITEVDIEQLEVEADAELDGEVNAMTETTQATEREGHLANADGAVLRADDLIAGYLPGVNILNGADLFC